MLTIYNLALLLVCIAGIYLLYKFVCYLLDED